ncbi:MAG: hypothetical protein K0R90_838 [Oscillospiraceae bacterium]|jgi:hypothetical protein|nr:hypothetical protein [Oscillospiraceae bacterium]
MNEKNINPKQLDELLKMASKKMGTSPEQLKSQLESGNLKDVLKNSNSKGSNKLNQVLSNPDIAEQLLKSPQARQLLKKLTEEK